MDRVLTLISSSPFLPLYKLKTLSLQNFNGTVVKEIPYTPNKIVKERVTKNLLKFVLHRTQLRLKSIKAIRQEMKVRISSVSERDLFMFGLGIYLGEGTKSFSITRIINADPRVIQLSILWLCKIFNVPKDNFVLRIYMYPDSKALSQNNLTI